MSCKDQYIPSAEALRRSPLAAALQSSGATAQQAADYFEIELAQTLAHFTAYRMSLGCPMIVRIEPNDAYRMGYENGTREQRDRAVTAATDLGADSAVVLALGQLPITAPPIEEKSATL